LLVDYHLFFKFAKLINQTIYKRQLERLMTSQPTYATV